MRTCSDELSGPLAHVFSRSNGFWHSLLFPKTETCIKFVAYSQLLADSGDSTWFGLSMRRKRAGELGHRECQAARASRLLYGIEYSIIHLDLQLHPPIPYL